MQAFIDLEKQSKLIKTRVFERFEKLADSAQFIGGSQLEECEDLLTEWAGRPALTVASGTDALLLALLALEFKAGDVVFVPAFTFAASAEVIALLGGTPYFVDVDPVSYNLSVSSLRQAILTARSQGKHSVGVISVDLFGQPAEHDTIAELAAENGLWVINDAAQSFGATYKQESVLKQGIISTTSFFPAKPLGCWGDGGAVFVEDADLFDKIKSLRVHGQGRDRYSYERVGINGRFDALQAAVIIEKLAIFSDEIKARQKVASIYDKALGNLVKTPTLIANCTSVYAQYTIRVPASKRDKLQRDLQSRGVPSVVYYPKPIHLQKAYCQYPAGDMSHTMALCDSVLSLPMHPYLTEENQATIIDAVHKSLAVSHEVEYE